MKTPHAIFDWPIAHRGGDLLQRHSVKTSSAYNAPATKADVEEIV